jgi:HAD superfamily hydrolase (TIGR01509 family)
MLRFRGVLLDVDGTLINSNDAHAQAWAQALAREGYQVPFDRVRWLIGMGSDHLLAQTVAVEKDSREGQRLRRWRKEIFASHYLPTLHAFPGVPQLVRRLREDGLSVVVASSAEADELQALLDIAGIRDLVEDITSSDEAERSKPSPDIIQAALGRIGYPAAEVVMLGDTPYDIAAAAQAGVGTIALRCGGWDEEHLQGALAVYDDPADLLARYEESPLGRVTEPALGA